MARRFSVLGDSISTFEGCNPDGYTVFYTPERAACAGLEGPRDTWWTQVIEHFGGELLVNGSFSGSMVEGEGFPAASCTQRVAALARDGRDPDVVLVFMGTNDYGWGGARAQAAGRSHAMPACVDLARIPPAVAGAAPDDALDGFESAYSSMLAQLRAAYPQAEVWCCALLPGRVVGSPDPTFAWNLRGVPMRAYNEAIARAARATGCRWVDTARFGLDYEAIEGTHPTRHGMRQIAALVVAAVEGRSVVDDAAGDDSAFGSEPSRWASRDLCPDRCCVGCPWAKDTSNTWCCVCTRPQER